MRKKEEPGKMLKCPFGGTITQGGKYKEKEQVLEKNREFHFGLTSLR